MCPITRGVWNKEENLTEKQDFLKGETIMEILEKVAYMKGLAEGIGLDVKSKEGKLLKVMMDILDDMALELQDIRDEQGDLEEVLDAVSEDLSEVETYLFEDDEEEDEDDDEEVYQTTCPNCGEELEFDLTDLSGCNGCCGACVEPVDDDDGDEDDDED